MDHILVGPVTDPLTALQNMLGEGVIEEPLQIITALLAVRVVSKERGNFYSMVFQGFAGSKQFVDLMVLMEELYLPGKVPVPATQL